jgi:hypothetical protein
LIGCFSPDASDVPVVAILTRFSNRRLRCKKMLGYFGQFLSPHSRLRTEIYFFPSNFRNAKNTFLIFLFWKGAVILFYFSLHNFITTKIKLIEKPGSGNWPKPNSGVN